MAKFAAIHGNLSGSIGGNTYSHNKGGPYVKRRAVPTNPQSARQVEVRGFLGFLASRWQALTDAQRSSWESWAQTHPRTDSLGNQVILTGLDCYIWLNSVVLDFGGTALDTPPAADFNDSLLTVDVVRTTATSCTITFTVTPLIAGTRLRAWMSRPTPGNRNVSKKNCTLIGYTAAAAASPQVMTIPFAWNVGETVNFYVELTNAEGQVGGALYDKVTA